MHDVSKFNPNHDELGRFTSAGGGKRVSRMPKGKGKGKKISAAERKKLDEEVNARTDKIVSQLGARIGKDLAEEWRPRIQAAMKVFQTPPSEAKFGEMDEPLNIGGKKFAIKMKDGKPVYLTATNVLDMVGNEIGTDAITGISDADFASGKPFRLKSQMPKGKAKSNARFGLKDTKKMTDDEVVKEYRRLNARKQKLEAELPNISNRVTGISEADEYGGNVSIASRPYVSNKEIKARIKQNKGLTAAIKSRLKDLDAEAKSRNISSLQLKLTTPFQTRITGVTDFSDKIIEKFNPYHDELGRFTSANSSASKTTRSINIKNRASKLFQQLQKNGGFTFDTKRNNLRRSGSAVAVSQQYERTFSPEDFAKNGEKYIKQYMKDFSEQLAGAKMHIGGWYSQDNNKIYLDISVVTRTPDEAADIARKTNQLAFFDMSNFKTYSRWGGDNRYYPQYESDQSRTGRRRSVAYIAPYKDKNLSKNSSGVIFVSVDELLNDFAIKSFVDKILAMSPNSISKETPTVSSVHLETAMGNQKKKKKRRVKSVSVEEIEKKNAKLKNPKGGLTQAGRDKFNRETGSKLKAGVKGAANTPEKMRRKGSFLTRFFTNPSGPMVGDNGEPTRLALSANAWGESVPKNRSDAARLAAKGRRLLERYENTKVKKFNPHHDELGRFTSGGAGKGGRRTAKHPADFARTRGLASIASRALAGGYKTKKQKRKIEVSRFNPKSGKKTTRLVSAKPKEKLKITATQRNEKTKREYDDLTNRTEQRKTYITPRTKSDTTKAKQVSDYMTVGIKRFKNAKHRAYASDRVKQMTGGKPRPKGMSKPYRMSKKQVKSYESVLYKMFRSGRLKYGI